MKKKGEARKRRIEQVVKRSRNNIKPGEQLIKIIYDVQKIRRDCIKSYIGGIPIIMDCKNPSLFSFWTIYLMIYNYLKIMFIFIILGLIGYYLFCNIGNI